MTWGRGTEEASYFYFGYFFSDSTEKFQEGTVRVVVQKTSGFGKVFKKEGGRGEYQDFPSKFFCLKVPKVFKKEPFCAVFQKSSNSKKVYR